MPNRIKILMHAYADENNYNAQNLNAKEIASRLNPEKYEVSLFYRSIPDSRLLGKENIKLIKVPNYISTFYLIYKFFGDYDILFYLRSFKQDRIYIFLRRIFGDNKKIFYYIEQKIEIFNKKLISRCINSSNFIYSVSNEVSKDVFEHFGVYTKVIYAGVDIETFKPKKEKSITSPNILYVGAFNERKRPFLILKLAEQFPDVDFHLIGDGLLKKKLISASKENKNIFIHNRVPEEILVNFMQDAHLFVHPSLMEGLGKVIIEAEATETPVIIFDLYGNEAIINEKTGFAVKDFDDMVDKTKFLLENDSFRSKMGLEARIFSKKFDWNIITRQWEREFDITAEISKGATLK